MQQFVETNDFLNTIVSEAEKNSENARALVDGLSEEQLNWKPSSDRWSIAQCLDHLAVTASQFKNYFPDTLSGGRQKWPTVETVPYRPTLVGGWLARQVNPEGGRKFPAPRVFRPSTSNISNSLQKFLTSQSDFIQAVREARGINYNKARLRSPVTPLMRYSIADAFVVTVLHGRRHLGQARRVRETPGFPS